MRLREWRRNPLVPFLVRCCPEFLRLCCGEEALKGRRKCDNGAGTPRPPRPPHYCSQHPPIIVAPCNKNPSPSTKREARPYLLSGEDHTLGRWKQGRCEESFSSEEPPLSEESRSITSRHHPGRLTLNSSLPVPLRCDWGDGGGA